MIVLALRLRHGAVSKVKAVSRKPNILWNTLRRTPHKSTDAVISIYNPKGDNSPLEILGC